MVSNELKKTLEKLGIYFFTFFFLYLVVAFFLKSEYPIYNYTFNRKDAYEVLRDGLTLLAYYLAPAVAFILFDDWRHQYIAVKSDKMIDSLFDKVVKIKEELKNVTNGLMYSRALGFNTSTEDERIKLILNINKEIDMLIHLIANMDQHVEVEFLYKANQFCDASKSLSHQLIVDKSPDKINEQTFSALMFLKESFSILKNSRPKL